MEDHRTVSARLHGDWTIAGVVRQIDPLTELSEQWDPCTRDVFIDCSGIEGIDVCGFQLLYIWLHCLEMRGLQPKLVQVPERVQRSQELLGLTRVQVFYEDDPS